MSAVIQLVQEKKPCKHGWVGSPSRCSGCRKEQYRARVAGNADLRKNVVLTEDGRVCIKCEQGKSWNDFVKSGHGYNGYTADCKPCRNIKYRQVYKDNPAVRRTGIKNRPDKLMRDYGITWEQAVRTLDKQHGLCANRRCGKEISLDVKGTATNRAVIDHSHETGKFRALMCSHCNSALGLIEKKKNMLIGLTEYLTEYNY